MKTRIICFVTLAALAALAGAALAEDIGIKRDFTYERNRDAGYVDVLKDKKVIARYVYKNTPKPYIYPLLAPCGEEVTRAVPAGEKDDHPHQRSCFLGYGDVSSVNFWAEGEKCGKIKQTSIEFDGISPGYWSIHTTNDWNDSNDRKVLDEDRRYSFLSCKYGTLMSTVLILKSVGQGATFNDSKEGFAAIRLAPGISLKDGKGHIMNSEGDTDDACWGKRARWIDYTGEVNGKTVGVTMFDVPTNYGFPTYWHARDYGLLAANPFGGKAFTGDEKNDSSLKMISGKPFRFVYITLIHDGKLSAETLDMIADEVAGRGRIKPGEEAKKKPLGAAKTEPKPAEASAENPKEPGKPADQPIEGVRIPWTPPKK